MTSARAATVFVPKNSDQERAQVERKPYALILCHATEFW